MKIALVGSHSTGKSTLLEELKKYKQFIDYKFITEVIRKFKKEYNLNINKNATEQDQLVFFNEYLKYLILESNFISDRSFLDAFAYALYIRDKINPIIIDYMYKITELYINKYDKILYLPVEFPLVKDGIRDTDIKYQRDIDKIIWNLLNYCEQFLSSDKVITLTGSVENRIKIIFNNL